MRSAIFKPMACTTAGVVQPAWHFNNTFPFLASWIERLGLRSSCAGQRAFQPFPLREASGNLSRRLVIGVMGGILSSLCVTHEPILQARDRVDDGTATADVRNVTTLS